MRVEFESQYSDDMRIEVEKASGRSCCYDSACDKDPEQINGKGKIIRGKTCVLLYFSLALRRDDIYIRYCRDCADKNLKYIKARLDPKVWILL